MLSDHEDPHFPFPLRTADSTQVSYLREIRLRDDFGPFVACRENFGFIPTLLRAQTLLPRLVEAEANPRKHCAHKGKNAFQSTEGADPPDCRSRRSKHLLCYCTFDNIAFPWHTGFSTRPALE
jgi:hypothetical protein